MTGWLQVERGTEPLVIAFPHTGVDLADVKDSFRTPWLARRDTDWWVHCLYDFAGALGATTVRTEISRSVIDVNRDPAGLSLYPGQATTGLCPATTFDGELLYDIVEPDQEEVARRRTLWFTPYHDAISQELRRLQKSFRNVVLYDAHSIRSRIPRLFDGKLPQFNIGTNFGASCSPELTSRVAKVTRKSSYDTVVDGRFRGGWTTRTHGQPAEGRHAIQMELAMGGYCDEPATPTPENWPPVYDPARAAPLAALLEHILRECLAFARSAE